MRYADNEEALDANLCYQALGVSIDDSPQRITENYERLVRQCKEEFNSSDPNVRASAREHLIIIEKMYNTIIQSVTYASFAREQYKSASEASKAGAANGPNAALRHISYDLTTCPSCKAQISKRLHSCPYCKTSFLTSWQKFQRKYLTMTNILQVLLLVLTIALGVVVLQNNFLQ